MLEHVHEHVKYSFYHFIYSLAMNISSSKSRTKPELRFVHKCDCACVKNMANISTGIQIPCEFS